MTNWLIHHPKTLISASILIALLMGIFGTLSILTIKTMMIDHWRVEQIWQLELNRAAAANKEQPQ